MLRQALLLHANFMASKYKSGEFDCKYHGNKVCYLILMIQQKSFKCTKTVSKWLFLNKYHCSIIKGKVSFFTFILCVKSILLPSPQKYMNYFHWIGTLGRFSHRVAMSVCLSVCSWQFKTPSSRGRGDLWVNGVSLILACDNTI